MVLPRLSRRPIGGYRVIYQYANGLAGLGHQVTVLHALSDEESPSLKSHVLTVVARVLWRLRPSTILQWFTLRNDVRLRLVPVLSGSILPAADVTLVTAWQSAARTGGPAARAGRLAQLVYDYETWLTDESLWPRIAAAVGRTDVAKISTSSAVATMLHSFGCTPVATVNAGLAEGDFGVDVPIASRSPSVLLVKRSEPSKDFATAVAVAQRVHALRPLVTFDCFGAAAWDDLPTFVRDHGTVSHQALRALYNNAAVLLLTSKAEGWGLPALEAMACGAVVVSTKSGGVEDFLSDDVNARLARPEDVDTLTNQVVALLDDDELRQRLALRATADAAELTMDKSLRALEAALRDVSIR